MGPQRIKEDTPRWDADKQRLFGPEELAAAGYEPPSPGSVIANEWWRVTDPSGMTRWLTARGSSRGLPTCAVGYAPCRVTNSLLLF